jgi:hypothetical protein
MIDSKPLFRFLRTTILFSLFSLLIVSCDATKQLDLVRDNNSAVELGNIVVKEGTLKNNIEIKGTPILDNTLRVSLVKRQFTSATHTQYKKALNLLTDSIALPSYYYELELIDDIGYATLINEDIVSREYVKISKSAGAITKINAVLKNAPSSIGTTTAFLESTSDNTIGVVLYNSHERIVTIPFSEMTIFDYQVSYFCFGKDQRNQVAVMDLVEEGKRCKRPLVKKAKKLTKIKRLVDY